MSSEEPQDRVRFGPFEADLHTREIWKDGLKVKLNGQPFEILTVLLSRVGEPVTRKELQQRIWPEERFIDSAHGLNAAVNKLRDALDDSAENPRYIETLPRRGYRFIGRLEIAVVDEPTELVPEMSVEIAPHVAPAAISRPGYWPIFLASSVALVIGAVGGIILNHGDLRAMLLHPVKSVSTANEPDIERQATAAENEEKARDHEIVESAPTPIIHRPILEHVDGHLRLTATVRTIISDGGNAGPQFSPDGKRIAFMSNRGGPWQVWLSKADGSNPVQLSDTDSAGTPRWSPDGRSIAFDAPHDGGTYIFIARVHDKPDDSPRARPLVEGLVPSFSRDGRWIYFASERSGGWQVWKVPANGGEEVQVTTQGGFSALQAADGYLYYSKSRYFNPEVWRMPVKGGEESLVSPHLRPRTWASWTVTENGILFVEDRSDRKSELSLYDPKKQETRDLATLPTSPFWMAATADGKKVVMNDSAERQISLLENIR